MTIPFTRQTPRKSAFRVMALVMAMGAAVPAVAQADGMMATDPLMQVDYTKFRHDFQDMYRVANPNLLGHRIFYDAPSTGPDAAWFDAVKQGNLEAVKAMVEAGQNLEAKDEDKLGQTALGWAAFIGYPDMVEYLVEKGADVRATDRGDVYHSLKSAVMGGNLDVIRFLHEKLKDEADWNALEDDGETLFLIGAVDGRAEFTEWALQFKPDLDVVTKKDNSALSLACEQAFYDVAQILIRAGAINHKTGKSSCTK